MNDQKSNARQHLTAGVLAVGQHLVDHDLPAPSSIDVDHASAELTLWIPDRNLIAYLDTLTVVDEAAAIERPSGGGRSYRVQRFWCLLPDTGIKVLIRSSSLDPEEIRP